MREYPWEICCLLRNYSPKINFLPSTLGGHAVRYRYLVVACGEMRRWRNYFPKKHDFFVSECWADLHGNADRRQTPTTKRQEGVPESNQQLIRGQSKGIWFVTSLPNGSAEMLSLLRTHTEQLKWTSKREKSMEKTVRKRTHGTGGTSHAPEAFLPFYFYFVFLALRNHCSCSAHVRYKISELIYTRMYQRIFCCSTFWSSRLSKHSHLVVAAF